MLIVAKVIASRRAAVLEFAAALHLPLLLDTFSLHRDGKWAGFSCVRCGRGLPNYLAQVNAL